MYAGHRSEDGRIQGLLEHLVETAQLTEGFASVFGAGAFGYQTGLAHDIGKYSDGSQNRILRNGPKVDHSTAGAKEANERISLIASYCIAGHHGGLPDGGNASDTGAEPTLCGKLKRTSIADYGAFRSEVELSKPEDPNINPIDGKWGFTTSFLIRMLFSCLVDADFLGTERFMSDGRTKRGGYDGISELCARLSEKLEPLLLSPTNEINEKRTAILRTCLDKANLPKGLFTLTVPTGGGKTKSSLAFALRHAKTHGMQRVIYVIPYTSIIEQNAAVFRGMLGKRNVLEHHSSVLYDDDNEEMTVQRLSTENWDAPVVVTTNVQFFESLFAARTSQCRKLHNIANSVIIFDEAQMLPLPYLAPCTRAITELVSNYGCSAILCSATQPALQRFFKDNPSTEIAEDPEGLYQFFRRAKIVNAGQLTDDELVHRLNSYEQALCIVNTRKHAQELYRLMEGEGTFHLSTLMFPKHRRCVLARIRRRLKRGLPCRVVSTSLIEAGVDLDFPVVFRSETGLDSQVQAAGRCNREGRNALEDSSVYVFRPEDKYLCHMPTPMRLPIEVASVIARKFDDTASPEALRKYFQTLYLMKGDSYLDSKAIVTRLEGCGQSFPFKVIAQDMKIIEEATCVVFVPIGDVAEALAERLRAGERSRALMRQMALYCVSVHRREFQDLHRVGEIEPLDYDMAILSDTSRYSKHTGLPVGVETGKGIFV